MGFLRTFVRGIKNQMVRDPLPPRAVAGGWALGMFVGCAVPFGCQLAVSIPLAIFFRLSKIGASVGTLVTNPVTIFFIYPAQTWAIDALLFGGNLSYNHLRTMQWTLENVRGLGFEAIVSFFLGGLALAVILTPITYFGVLHVVNRYRRSRTA